QSGGLPAARSQCQSNYSAARQLGLRHTVSSLGSVYSRSHHPEFPLLLNSAWLVAGGCVVATDRSGSQPYDWPNSRPNQIFSSINSNSFSNGQPNSFAGGQSNCYTQGNPDAQTHTQAPPWAQLSDEVNSSVLQLLCA